MKKIVNNITNNWILYVMVLQPLLDIIAFFQQNSNFSSLSFLVRGVLLIFIVLFSFIKTKRKKSMILSLLPIAGICFIHLLNTILNGSISLFMDIKYLVMVMQMPVILVSLNFYLKEDEKKIENIKKGFIINFVIIFISLVISYFTNSYNYTYNYYGITGWFNSANTQSMILVAIAPLFLYYMFEKKNKLLYFLANIMMFIVLYYNATKACYLALICTLIVMLYICLCMKNNQRRYYFFITLMTLLVSIFTYFGSSTYSRQLEVDDAIYESTIIEEQIEEEEILKEEIDFENINYNNREEVLKILNTSYYYKELIEIHGEDKILEKMNNKITAYSLIDNRLRKRLNAEIEFENSNLTTKLFGLDFATINNVQLDLENDITAVFYYYGVVGFIVYMGYILYFVFKLAIKALKEKQLFTNGEIIMLLFLVMLLLFGGEYSGAFLRKPNANIYLSFILILMNHKILFIKEDKKEKKANKITFLNLHLGYGGIETSTINSANKLVEKYDVEIISFYNLKENQEKLLDQKINVKYLYNDGPNKKEVLDAIKNKNIISCFKEGCKAIKILYLKKDLIKKSILNCDSKFIVSTRWEFSRILSKYKPNDIIAIAQEHHHHNNKTKYIKILSEEYEGIDYLFALNETLGKDYKSFLKNNDHTQIVVVPNMVMQSKTMSEMKKRNIISVGRLHPGKKIPEIVKMVPHLKNVDQFFIIGDGEDYNKIEELIKELKLTKKVKLLGYKNREEIEKYYKDSVVFVMASETEGLPMVLIEAMSSGIPCIAYETDCGVGDIIDDNENGYIIKNRNENNYINKLDELLGDYKKLKKFSEKAIKKANKFSPSEVFKIWDKILSKKEDKTKNNFVGTIKDTIKDIFSSEKLNKIIFFICAFAYLAIIDVYNRCLIIGGLDPNVFTSPESMAFNLLWISSILIIFSICRGWFKKLLIISIELVLLIFSVVNYFVFSYFGNAFSWKDIVLSGDGMSFISSIFKYINLPLMLFIVLCIGLIIITVFLSKYSNLKIKSVKTVIIAIFMVLAIFNYKENYANLSGTVDGWDSRVATNSNSNYYSSWINPNKLILIGGTYDYLVRDFYESFLKTENIKESNEYIQNKLIELEKTKKKESNNYKGIFKDKNLIFVMMESMDDWLINEEITPTISYMMKHGFYFTNHYSPVYVTGSTANTEFIANTGIYPNINKLSPNYAYVDNNYEYALPTLFKKAGYKVNSFHRSNGFIYNRANMHLSFGYEKYYNYAEMGISENDLDLDSYIAIDGYDKIVDEDKFMSFIITYSPHTPYSYDKIECQKNLNEINKLNLETENEEELCGYSSARETDNMFKLLIEKLKSDGILDDTVIVAFTDHPNYLKVAEDETDQLNKTSFFIYNSKMEEHKYNNISSTINILPTIKNLFDIKGDYYYPGCDLLNCNDNYIIFNNLTYYDGKEILPLKEKQKNDIDFSKHLLVSNYYK